MIFILTWDFYLSSWFVWSSIWFLRCYCYVTCLRILFQLYCWIVLLCICTWIYYLNSCWNFILRTIWVSDNDCCFLIAWCCSVYWSLVFERSSFWKIVYITDWSFRIWSFTYINSLVFRCWIVLLCICTWIYYLNSYWNFICRTIWISYYNCTCDFTIVNSWSFSSFPCVSRCRTWCCSFIWQVRLVGNISLWWSQIWNSSIWSQIHCRICSCWCIFISLLTELNLNIGVISSVIVCVVICQTSLVISTNITIPDIFASISFDFLIFTNMTWNINFIWVSICRIASLT